MSKIPCKKCNNCGLYNDITVNVCECGTDITNIPGLLVDENIPMELYGEINEELTYYVQKCSACGALNFTTDPLKKVKTCHNCHKSRVAFVTPVPYVDHEETQKEEEEEKQTPLSVVQRLAETEVDDDDDDDDDDCGTWGGILGNIKQATGQSKQTQSVPPTQETPAPKLVVDPTAQMDDDDDDDDDEVGGWANILGAKTGGQSKPVQSKTSELTLTAIRYGRFSHTFKSDDSKLPILLGRSAELGDFLMADGRVGNQHCYLSYKNGAWYVTDNHSANGTAINQRDIGLNGERKLNNGDELKLGHHPDSMEFRVTII